LALKYYLQRTKGRPSREEVSALTFNPSEKGLRKMQSTNPALFAQLQAAHMVAAQRAISLQTAGIANEAKERHPQNTVAAHQSRQQYETASWMAFSQSLTGPQVFVVFEAEHMGQGGIYASIDASAFVAEWGEVVAAYQGGLRYDAARLAHFKFEIANACTSGITARYVDIHPDEAELHRDHQCKLFEECKNKRLDKTDKKGRLRAAYIICGRYVSSWTELTPAEELKLTRAIAAGAFAPGWIYNPAACLH
jgi:hypothetical protein